MTPPLSIGDEAEIIGPSILGDDKHLGERFVITGLSTITQRIPFSPYDGMYYPASSLRLVEEELKVGDLVEIIRPNIEATEKIMKVIRTEEPPRTGFPIQLDDKSWWRPTSLRKLTPEEVAKHTSKNIGEFTAVLKLDTSEFESGMDKAIDKMWKLHVDERLSAIESRLDGITKCGGQVETQIGEIEEDLDKIFKRLQVLEGERPEVIDREQIRMPVNASISMRSDVNGKVSIDYSSGGFELAKAVLDCMGEG